MAGRPLYKSHGTAFEGRSIHWPHIQHQSIFYGGWQQNYCGQQINCLQVGSISSLCIRDVYGKDLIYNGWGHTNNNNNPPPIKALHVEEVNVECFASNQNLIVTVQNSDLVRLTFYLLIFSLKELNQNILFLFEFWHNSISSHLVDIL